MRFVCLTFVVALAVPQVGLAQDFTEVPNAYSRVVSPFVQTRDDHYANGLVVPFDVPTVALKPGGQPGIAMIDYDVDGDVDLFVSNGPGAAHSLFENDGSANFTDVADLVGVAETDQDGGGTCFGDLDNDGDPDLLVLGLGAAEHRLFRNEGGWFSDATDSAGLGGPSRGASSCTMGDIENDGDLDIYIGNTYPDWFTHVHVFFHNPDEQQHNQLFVNNGDWTFSDESAARGLEDTRGFADPSLPPGERDGDATITWAVAMVDTNGDGYIDIVHADDQGPQAPALAGGIDRGFVHIFLNDGTGYFTDQTADNGLAIYGAWMGLAFADFDHDGDLDYFASNAGDYMFPFMGIPYALGDLASRWFLSNGDGTYADPGVGALVATPFGWGASAFDVENDGDADIAFFGGLDVTVLVLRDNPGTLLLNDGDANFSYDAGALSPAHSQRNVMGAAAADLNGDGCTDIATASNADHPVLAPIPLAYGSPFDATALFIPTMMPDPADPDPSDGVDFIKTPGVDPLNGTLSIELNSCDSGYGSIQVDTVGSVGLTDEGSVNRSGFGAVVSVTPQGGQTAMLPVVGGSSHASQNSEILGFGLGSARRATVDVTWPGGVRNRLYNVRDGASVLFPEIPCSIDTDDSFYSYRHCVVNALRDLRHAGIISPREAAHLRVSAIRAYFDQ